MYVLHDVCMYNVRVFLCAKLTVTVTAAGWMNKDSVSVFGVIMNDQFIPAIFPASIF